MSEFVNQNAGRPRIATHRQTVVQKNPTFRRCKSENATGPAANLFSEIGMCQYHNLRRGCWDCVSGITGNYIQQ